MATLTDDELRAKWDAEKLTPDEMVQALVRLFGYDKATATVIANSGFEDDKQGDSTGIQ